MKRDYRIIRFLILCAVFFLFSGCENPTTIVKPADETPVVETPKVPKDGIRTADGIRYVKNSAWESCSLEYLLAKTNTGSARAAEITDSDLETIVDTLNSAENDNQYFIETEDTAITEAPTVDIYIVNECNPNDGKEDDWQILKTYLAWDREDYASRPGDFAAQAMNLGGILFVDKVPPKPEPPIVKTDHERYAAYVYSILTGKILYETHCEEIWEGNFDSLEQCFQMTTDAYRNGCAEHNAKFPDDPWGYVVGELYVEPN